MKEESVTDALLREFLLGKLGEEDRETVEDLFLTDFPFRERLQRRTGKASTDLTSCAPPANPASNRGNPEDSFASPGCKLRLSSIALVRDVLSDRQILRKFLSIDWKSWRVINYE